MINFVIGEINGKQYKIEENKPFLIDKMEGKEIEAQVLCIVKDDNIELGKPYLKKKIKLEILEDVKGKKIRVAKFHAKANYRKVTGSRPKYSKTRNGDRCTVSAILS